MISVIRRWYKGSTTWLKRYGKDVVIVTFVTIFIGVIAAQFLYPIDRTLPFTKVDGVQIGGWSKHDAVKMLNDRYKQKKIDLYFEGATQAFASPSLGDLGLTVDNSVRIVDAQYPWYLRVIPSSLLWASAFNSSASPTYSRDLERLDEYMLDTFGSDCQVDPINATLEVVDNTLQVVGASPGGVCDKDEVTEVLKNLSPRLSKTSVYVSGEKTPALISDEMAQEYANAVSDGVDGGISVTFDDKVYLIEKERLLSWITFSEANGTLTASLDKEKASSYLNQQFADVVKRAAGTTIITTYDFVEISRQVGVSGRSFDLDGMLASLEAAIRDDSSVVAVAVKEVSPTVTYNRSYSNTDTGLAALLKNYAESHSGTYGASIIELSGARRHASYNGDTQFITASTYKLFVAYSTLLRIESGEWKWSDIVRGSDTITVCFDKMISLSNNECAHALLDKIGFTNITNEARAIGSSSTTFLDKEGIKSTANDEALLLSLLQTGQILSTQSSRDRLINALKSNVYRQGIPAGIPSVTIANKVGFLDGLLHDAAIVYDPLGTYVLVILTDDASWANISELAALVQTLRKS
jgi:beta-lactamase class A